MADYKAPEVSPPPKRVAPKRPSVLRTAAGPVASNQVVTVKDADDFKSFTSGKGKMRVVFYYATWNADCKPLLEALTDIGKTFSEHVEIGKVNVDASEDLADSQKVGELPIFQFWQDGQKLAQLQIVNRDKVSAVIKQYMS
eukprot:g38191.t1